MQWKWELTKTWEFWNPESQIEADRNGWSARFLKRSQCLGEHEQEEEEIFWITRQDIRQSRKWYLRRRRRCVGLFVVRRRYGWNHRSTATAVEAPAERLRPRTGGPFFFLCLCLWIFFLPFSGSSVSVLVLPIALTLSTCFPVSALTSYNSASQSHHEEWSCGPLPTTAVTSDFFCFFRILLTYAQKSIC